jgi:hypothetical protein
MSNDKPSLAQDFTTALNLSLRPSRIIVLSFGLLIGVAAAILFFWVGRLIDKPALLWLGWILQRIGALAFGYVVLASMCSVAAMAHAEATGERIGVPGGWALIARHIGPVVLATLKPIIVFLLAIAIIWGGGLLGLIPQVGPILWAITSPIWIAVGLLAIFVLVRLLLVVFVFPGVVSVTKEKGTACYKESLRFVKGHIAHVLGRAAVALLACFVLYRIIVAGFGFTASHTSRTMGRNTETLYGSALLDHMEGVPGLEGTAPRGFGAQNPAGPFRSVAWTRTTRAAPQGLVGLLQAGGARLPIRGTRAVGGWIFSVIFIVLCTVIFSVVFILLSLSGYCAYVSLKDAPEMPLKTEELDLSAIKETAQEIAGKRKGERSEKKPKGEAEKGKPAK